MELRIIQIIVLIFSAVIHEISHGLMAERLGDDTARREGRITLNPLPHLDPFASVILPAFLVFVGSPVILGAAKPVPVDFESLRPRKLGMALVSLAGPLSNFVLAVIFALPIKLGFASGLTYEILIQIVLINLVLGVFNLIPIPPLDGSKIIAAFLPDRLMYTILSFEQYGFILVFLFLWLGWLDRLLLPVVMIFANLMGL